MGLFKISDSQYDKQSEPRAVYVLERVLRSTAEPKPSSGNPDPYNWIEVRHRECGSDNLVVWLRYPDCFNYEGNKILVYLDTTWKQLKAQRIIDPHFSSNKRFLSPFARFEPTEAGWDAACVVAELTS